MVEIHLEKKNAYYLYTILSLPLILLHTLQPYFIATQNLHPPCCRIPNDYLENCLRIQLNVWL